MDGWIDRWMDEWKKEGKRPAQAVSERESKKREKRLRVWRGWEARRIGRANVIKKDKFH